MIIYASATISWSGSRGTDNVSGGVLGVELKRSEFMLMKSSLPNFSIERIVRREIVKIPAKISLIFNLRRWYRK